MKKMDALFAAFLFSSPLALASEASTRERCELLNEADRKRISELAQSLAQERSNLHRTPAGADTRPLTTIENLERRISLLQTSIECRRALLAGAATFERFVHNLPVSLTEPALITQIVLPSEAHEEIRKITERRRRETAAVSEATFASSLGDKL